MNFRDRALLFVLLPAVLAGACLDPASEPGDLDACEAVREHAIALQLADAQTGGAAMTPALVRAHGDAMRTALGDAYLASCAGRGPTWAACARKASSAAELEQCGSVTP